MNTTTRTTNDTTTHRPSRLHHVPCWFLGHTYRHTPGDTAVLTCTRCGSRELLVVKQIRDHAQQPWF